MNSNNKTFLGNIPPVTLNLIIINVLMWVASIILPSVIHAPLDQYLGLHYWGASDFMPFQLLTYMFMHDTSGISHLFFNMFSLWMFGRILEDVMGSARYLFFYITCGLGAGLIQEVVWMLSWKEMFVPALASINPGFTEAQILQEINTMIAHGESLPFLNQLVTIGASGAVFGILLGFGMLFPNLPMYIIFLPMMPIKAKWMVIGYGLIELAFGVTGIMNSVAHFAHLGGMLFGFLLIYYWKKKGVINGYY